MRAVVDWYVVCTMSTYIDILDVHLVGCVSMRGDDGVIDFGIV